MNAETTSSRSRGYTLIEIMVSITLMMMLMVAMSQIFAYVGTEVNNTQAVMLMAGNLRNTNLLERDLSMLSAETKIPARAADNKGYFCYIEGSDFCSNPFVPANPKSVNSRALNKETGLPDLTVIDNDDILMLTAVAPADAPFRGRCGANVIESNAAEIIWFVRGTTLYRRVLLIIPDAQLQKVLSTYTNADLPNLAQGFAFYHDFDVSVRVETNANGANPHVVANTLGDLTLRDNRYAHGGTGTAFPNNIHANNVTYTLGMPLMQECSDAQWGIGKAVTAQTGLDGGAWPAALTKIDPLDTTNLIDFWDDAYPWVEVDQLTGRICKPARDAGDVVLNNVIGFDVKIWDESLPVPTYVDLGTVPGLGPSGTNTNFSGTGAVSGLERVYDTWSDIYERLPNGTTSTVVGTGLDQMDNNGDGVIDDAAEWQFPPPYSAEMKGLQVTIRVFDPRSRHIRQKTFIIDYSKK